MAVEVRPRRDEPRHVRRFMKELEDAIRVATCNSASVVQPTDAEQEEFMRLVTAPTFPRVYAWQISSGPPPNPDVMCVTFVPQAASEEEVSECVKLLGSQNACRIAGDSLRILQRFADIGSIAADYDAHIAKHLIAFIGSNLSVMSWAAGNNATLRVLSSCSAYTISAFGVAASSVSTPFLTGLAVAQMVLSRDDCGDAIAQLDREIKKQRAAAEAVEARRRESGHSSNDERGGRLTPGSTNTGTDSSTDVPHRDHEVHPDRDNERHQGRDHDRDHDRDHNPGPGGTIGGLH